MSAALQVLLNQELLPRIAFAYAPLEGPRDIRHAGTLASASFELCVAVYTAGVPLPAAGGTSSSESEEEQQTTKHHSP